MALTKTQVSQLYVSIFGRASEGDGNTYWQAQTDLITAAANMLATPAAATYFGSSLDTDQAFIEHIYKNTLGKTYAEDTEGVDYWVSLLVEGGKSRGEVVAAIIEAAQAPENAGVAQNMFNNKVAVSDYVADTIATADLADLSAFTNYIKDVDDTTVSVDTAKEAAKADADAAATTNALVPALETLDAANTAKSDALKAKLEEYLADKVIKSTYSLTDKTTLNSDNDGTIATVTVEEVVVDLYDTAANDLSSNGSGASYTTVANFGTQTATIQDAAISATTVTLEAAVTSAKITAANGMTSLLTKADTKAEAYKAALDAKNETANDLKDEIALFATANSNATMAATPVVKLADYTGIVNAEIVVMTKAEYEASTTDFTGEFLLVDGVVYNGVNANTVNFADLTKSKRSDELSSAYSADVSAKTAVDSAYTSLASAVKAVYIAEKGAYAVVTADSSLTAINVNSSNPSDNVVTLDFDQTVDVYATKADKDFKAAAVAQEFTLVLNASLSIGDAADDTTIAFDGTTIELADGDDAAAVAAALAGETYTNWTAVDNEDGSVTFTAKVAGSTADVVIGDFTFTPGTDTDTSFTGTITVDTQGADAVTGKKTTVQATKADDLYEAIAKLKAFNEAVAEFTAAREDRDALDALNEAITDATEAITNATDATKPGLGVDLVTFGTNFTADNEVSLLDTSAANVILTGFGAAGLDQIFVGSDYTFVAMGKDEKISDSLGDASKLEIFYEEVSGDVKLYIEKLAVAGSGTTTNDMLVVTLSGVPLEDVTMDGGFISAGTIA